MEALTLDSDNTQNMTRLSQIFHQSKSTDGKLYNY